MIVDLPRFSAPKKSRRRKASKVTSSIPKPAVISICLIGIVAAIGLINSILPLMAISLIGTLIWLQATKPPMEFKQDRMQFKSEPSGQRKRYLKSIEEEERRVA